MNEKNYAAEKGWELRVWDGNPSLKHVCYRKKFGRGHVSIGVGDFMSIVYSYGANSDSSISGTRRRQLAYGRPDQTVLAAMQMVDRNKGKHNHLDVD